MGLVQSVVESGLGLCVIVCAIGYFTKPTDKSFKKYLDKDIKKNINEATEDEDLNVITKYFVRKIVKNVAKIVITYSVDNYAVCKLGTISYKGKRYHFVGILNTWWPLFLQKNMCD